MGRYNTKKENVEYFYRHFNEHNINTTKRSKIVGTICMAVNQESKEIAVAGAVAGHGDQFSKKIGREIARGRVNAFFAGEKLREEETGLVKTWGLLSKNEDPTEILFDLDLGRENGYIAVVEAE